MNQQRSNSKLQTMTEIPELLDNLGAHDLATRRDARLALQSHGRDAVPALLDRLASGPFPVRWEIVKILGAIGDPAALPALIQALEDQEHDVRWVAAVALIRFGPRAHVPLLETLTDKADVPAVRQGVHHVLTAAQDRQHNAALDEVLDALGPMEDPSHAIPAAERAIRALQP